MELKMMLVRCSNVVLKMRIVQLEREKERTS